MPRRAAPFARLSPLQPGLRAQRRGWRRALVLLGALAGLAAAVVGDVVSPLIGAIAAVALVGLVLLVAVLWPAR